MALLRANTDGPTGRAAARTGCAWERGHARAAVYASRDPSTESASS